MQLLRVQCRPWLILLKTALPTPLRIPRFATTQWSLVLSAKDAESPDSRRALSQLCEAYWYPLYAFVRREGYQLAEAQDLTQGFFADLLERNFLEEVHQDRGRFRSFLLAALKHFLSKQREQQQAQKRGGDRRQLSIDFHEAEDRYRNEPYHEVTAEQLFEKRWILTILDRVVATLRSEYARTGRLELFDCLKACLTGEEPAQSYREIAQELGLTESTVGVTVHRLRQRYRDLLRAEIAQTVAEPESIDDEIRTLFSTVCEKNQKKDRILVRNP